MWLCMASEQTSGIQGGSSVFSSKKLSMAASRLGCKSLIISVITSSLAIGLSATGGKDPGWLGGVVAEELDSQLAAFHLIHATYRFLDIER
jgi:hypothetical protein